MIYIIIFLIVIIGFLGLKLSQKQQINKNELEHYKNELNEIQSKLTLAKHNYTKYGDLVRQAQENLQTLEIECRDARNERMCEETHTKSLKQAADEALERYYNTVDIKMKELDASMEEQRSSRQSSLDLELKAQEQLKDKTIQEYVQEVNEARNTCETAIESMKQDTQERIEAFATSIEIMRKKYESILMPIQQYEKDRQARVYYTLQIPEEYQEDINFLLTTVAGKVKHPDIISKLVWSEYVKPAFDEMVKRTGIEPKAGIYKITNLDTEKCYIGRSVDVKKRLTDHYKSSVGITNIADQAIHHAMLKEGLWNWSNEIITYCDKEQLSELEKYYIEFFKSQEYGYNRTGGS